MSEIELAKLIVQEAPTIGAMLLMLWRLETRLEACIAHTQDVLETLVEYITSRSGD